VHDVLLIIKREFNERVASRSFIIGTLVFPVLMIGLILLPRLVGSSGTEWRLALVNEEREELHRLRFLLARHGRATIANTDAYRKNPSRK